MASLARLLEKLFINLFLHHCDYHHPYLEENDDDDVKRRRIWRAGIWVIIMWNQGGACIGSGTRADNPEAFLN